MCEKPPIDELEKAVQDANLMVEKLKGDRDKLLDLAERGDKAIAVIAANENRLGYLKSSERWLWGFGLLGIVVGATFAFLGFTQLVASRSPSEMTADCPAIMRWNSFGRERGRSRNSRRDHPRPHPALAQIGKKDGGARLSFPVQHVNLAGHVQMADRKYMKQAIDLSQRCNPTDPKRTPKLGVVIEYGGIVLAAAHRGTGDPGDDEHAEKLRCRS